MVNERNKSGIVLLLAGVWKWKGFRRNAGKRRCSLCLGEEDVKGTLQDFLKTINKRMKFLKEKCLNMNKEIAYRKLSIISI